MRVSEVTKGAEGFDWVVEFAEVFIVGGFDISIANPPYVRMELFKDIKPLLRKNFQAVHSDRTDLYCYFYARAVELLRQGGSIAFISSGKWLRSGYGKKLRAYLGANTRVGSVIDFGDLPVFQAASAYPIIFTARKGTSNEPSLSQFVEVPSLEHPYPDVAAVIAKHGRLLPDSCFTGEIWNLVQQGVGGSVKAEATLREYVGGKIFYGVKTGLNEAFVIDSETRTALIKEDRRTSKFIKSLISGRDITRWKAGDSGKSLLYLPHGVDIKDAGPVLRHLRPFKKQLEARATKQEWYELQQPQYRYAQQFNQPKIIYQVFQVKPCFALDLDGSYVSNSVYVIPTDDLFLLAVMNSTPFWGEVTRCCSKIQNGYQLMLTYFERVRIPDADRRDKRALELLAAKCIEDPNQCLADIEAEIDERVAVLYGRQ